MEINIELLTPQVVKENTSSLSQAVPDNVYQDLLREIEKDPELQSIFDGMVATPTVDGNVDEQAVGEQTLDRLVQESLQETPLESELHM